MLISHQYKFIFIKTSKTAGTSIEVDLGKLMGPEDIVTPVFPHVDGHVPRNYKRGFLRKDFNNHMAASKIKKILGKKSFDSYFKFCVEREPVDKTLSHYFMWKGRNPKKNGEEWSWEEYVERRYFPVDTATYLDNEGRLLVDKIIRFENLAQEFSETCESLGLTTAKISTNAKQGHNKKKIDVTSAQRQIIYDAFAPTLKFTHYEL